MNNLPKDYIRISLLRSRFLGSVRDFNIEGRDHTILDWTLECGIREFRLPKRFLIIDILVFGIRSICK